MSTNKRLLPLPGWPLLLFATLMVILGGLAIFSPRSLEHYLPGAFLDYFSRYGWLATLLCIVGLTLHVIVVLYALTRPKTVLIRSFKELDAEPQNEALSAATAPAAAIGKVSRFYNAKLVHKHQDVIKLKCSTACLYFLALLLAAGVAACGYMSWLMGLGDTPERGMLGLLLTGLSLLLGVLGLFKFAEPMVFDKQSGYFWQGFAAARSPDQIYKNARPLSRIHALQVLSGKGGRSGHELNLVLTDSSRINLMEHGCPRTIAIKGKQLSKFLQVPLWSSTVG